MLFQKKAMFDKVRLRLFEILHFPDRIPYSLLVISGFVVATSKIVTESVLKWDIVQPGRGCTQCNQEHYQST